MRTTNYFTKKNLKQKTTLWLDEIRHTVALKPNLQLSLDKCALIIVDMNNYFTSNQGQCFLPASEVVCDQIKSLLDVWRSAKKTIVFTKHGHQGPNDLGMMGRFFADYIKSNTPESEIIDKLKPLSGEKIFTKTTYDSFIGTNLEFYLKEKNIEQVLITGVLTHMCCETTARSAFCRGFEVYVAVDAMASHCEQRHVGSLLSMTDALAVAMSTQEIITKCKINPSFQQ